MIQRDELIKIGKFNKPHGIKGELSFSFTDDSFDESECPFLICELDGIFVPFRLEESRFTSANAALVKLKFIDSDQKARRLANQDVYFPKKHKRESEEESMAMFDGSEKSFWKATGFLTNDLEAIAQTEHPVLCEIRTFLQKEGAGYTAMSGSGSCMFGIFSGKKACISAKEKAEAAFPSTFFISDCVLGEERPL